MNTTLDELEALTVEYQQRVAGRPLSDAERAALTRSIARVDEVRTSLAGMLIVEPVEQLRAALAGHDRGREAGRVVH